MSTRPIQSPPVSRGGTRPIAALVAAAFAAVLLAACGGSGSSTSTTGSTAAEKTSTQKEGGATATAGGASKKSDSGGASSKQSGSSNDSGGSAAKDVATPLKVSGGGSGQFRTKGGDNSIQEFGSESDESELREAAEAVHGFYVARAKEDWSTACSYLAKSNVEQLEKLASQSSQLKGQGCAPVLKAFTRPLPAAVQREITTVDAGSLRRKGEQSFLIYYGPDKTVYAMPMKQENGAWKVAALAGVALS